MASDLTWTPAWRLREMIAQKELSPVEVVDHFLSRIEALEPRLKAFAHLDPEGARRQAKAAEAAVMAGDALGPLHGVPMAVKSHIEVTDYPRPAPPISISGISRQDDLPVERLRRAGAVIVGHNSMPTFTPQGALDLEALARNPWDLARVPGASSSGGAAAVASGMLPAVLGTDGGGSTRLPSAYCGLVGVHPTDRSVPRLIDPEHFEPHIGWTVGPMTRDVLDAATILSVIAGPDGRDPLCLPVDLANPLSSLDDGARGMRLAWSSDLGFASSYFGEATLQTIETLRSAAMALTSTGAIVEETTEIWEDYVESADLYQAVFPDVPLMGLPPLQVTAAQWDAATALRQRNWTKFERLFRDFDLLLCPAQHVVAPTFETFRELFAGGPPDFAKVRAITIYLGMFNWLGFPAAAVGCGFVEGMPVALQIVGPPGSDAKILRLARAMRQAFPRDERPTLD